jgi:plastocyanin
MRRRAFLTAAAAAGTPLLAGCGGGGGGDPPEETTIEIASAGNTPVRARVAVGGTVTWRNTDAAAINDHTVTSAQFDDRGADWAFDEALPDRGDEVSHTFEEAGVYHYYDEEEGRGCRCGVVLVGDVEYSQPLPCSTASPASC